MVVRKEVGSSSYKLAFNFQLILVNYLGNWGFNLVYTVQNRSTKEKKWELHLCCIFATTLEDESDGAVHPTL